MDKKYELIRCDELLTRLRPLICSMGYRVKYLKDIPRHGVKAGQIGGFVKGEHNLDHTGDCCVLDNAMIVSDAVVRGNAIIKDRARVAGHAMVFGNATVQGNAIIAEHASVRGYATIAADAVIAGDCMVLGDAIVRGDVRLGGDLMVSDNACIVGSGEYYKIEKGEIAFNANIESDRDLLVIGPMGSRYAYTTFYKSCDNQIYVKCGCFNDTLENFECQVNQVHGHDKHGERYRKAIETAKQMIALR